MKILLAIILIFPIFNIVAQNPVQPKDSTVGKDELIIISPEKKSPFRYLWINDY